MILPGKPTEIIAIHKKISLQDLIKLYLLHNSRRYETTLAQICCHTDVSISCFAHKMIISMKYFSDYEFLKFMLYSSASMCVYSIDWFSTSKQSQTCIMLAIQFSFCWHPKIYFTSFRVCLSEFKLKLDHNIQSINNSLLRWSA